MVTVTEAYFDESYEDKAPRVLCVAGYVFRKSKAVAFGRQWSAYLQSKGLPYFHANECAHREGVFKGWDNADCGVVSRKLIAMTKEYSDYGVAVTLDQADYEEICQGHEMFPSAYAYVLMNCLYRIAHWRERAGRAEPTAFFFEQGHRHAKDASRFLDFMVGGDELPSRIGYRSHDFLPKETPQLHSGDLLAWLCRLHCGRLLRGDQVQTRQDFIALKRPGDDFILMRRPALEEFRNSILTNASRAEALVHDLAMLRGLPSDLADAVASWRVDYRKPGHVH